MNKKQLREYLLKKYNGKCAFCGHPLDKGVYISPIVRPKIAITQEGEIKTIDDDIDLKLPACISCHGIRSYATGDKNEIISIERFRESLKKNFEFLHDNTYFQRALRFGMIEKTNQPIVFYFERISADKNENL